jgi:hypothetical protein
MFKIINMPPAEDRTDKDPRTHDLTGSHDLVMSRLRLRVTLKCSFGFHHLGLESKNLFMILANTCLAVTELVMAFISNFMAFHFMPNLNTYWVPCHFCGFSK